MRKIAKIYLIDDSEVDNYFHQIVCEKSGVVGEIQSFICPERALSHFSVSPVQPGEFVFLDINMPRMTGFEFLDQLSLHESVQGMFPFVVMISTSSNPKDSTRARSYSVVHDYLTKALSKHYLIALNASCTDVATTAKAS